MKMAVLVSGGVDSSVALYRLRSQGYDVEAFYLKIWLEDELAYLGDCPWQEDLTYAQAICDQLQVPLHVVPLQKEYWERIVHYTIAEIKEGRTPNPDVFCNTRVKFGAFLEGIDSSYDKVATGHYAWVEQVENEYHLFTTPDPIKDQTYFLSHLTQDQLKRALFPIGDMPKQEVRRLAHEANLATMDRKDSQGICFLGKLKFRDFVKHHVGIRPGKFIESETGTVVGTHEGFWFYTVGQRQGIGLSGGPWYVVRKDPVENIVYISRHYYSDDKLRNQMIVHSFNWIGSHKPIEHALVKLRHGALFHEANVTCRDDNSLQLTLKESDQGIAPGQIAVLYDGKRCLGGGVITKAL